MAITADLVGSETPQRVQIVVSATPSGQSWTLYGSAGDLEWVVPGGMGVGDGNQLTLIDNRGPLNTPITYRFVANTTQTAAPITRVQALGDAVIQSLDGQTTVVVNMQDGSQNWELQPNQQLFRIPNRRKNVARYAATSDQVGQVIFKAPFSVTPVVDGLFATGQPLLLLFTAPALDLPLVLLFMPTGVSSTGSVVTSIREWVVPYVLVDDPYLDVRLGAFSWDYFDQVWAGKTWNDFDAFMSGRSWNEFDSIDWSTV